MAVRYYTAGPPGEGGEFDKIQDAIDQAVLDQSGVQDSVVKVLPGVYVEDINLAAGVNLVGAVGSRAEIQGTLTMDLTSLGSRDETGVSLRHLTLRGVGSNPVIQFTGATPQTAIISDCQIFPEAGAAIVVDNTGFESGMPSSLWVVDSLVERKTPSVIPMVQHNNGLFAGATSLFNADTGDVAFEIDGSVNNTQLETQVSGQIHVVAGFGSFLRPKIITGTVAALVVEAGATCATNGMVVQCDTAPCLQGDGALFFDTVAFSGTAQGVDATLNVSQYPIEGVAGFLFTPETSSDWAAPAPSTLVDAVNRLASAVAGLLGNPIP